jgi:hypothetical protein
LLKYPTHLSLFRIKAYEIVFSAIRHWKDYPFLLSRARVLNSYFSSELLGLYLSLSLSMLGLNTKLSIQMGNVVINGLLFISSYKFRDYITVQAGGSLSTFRKQTAGSSMFRLFDCVHLNTQERFYFAQNPIIPKSTPFSYRFEVPKQ